MDKFVEMFGIGGDVYFNIQHIVKISRSDNSTEHSHLHMVNRDIIIIPRTYEEAVLRLKSLYQKYEDDQLKIQQGL